MLIERDIGILGIKMWRSVGCKENGLTGDCYKEILEEGMLK